MEQQRFDRLARGLAQGFSRRSVLRRFAGSAIAGPLGAGAVGAAFADGKDKDKDKDKDDKDKGRAPDRGNSGNSGCRDLGHPCAGNQDCCDGLACLALGQGAAPRCVPSVAGGTSNATTAGQVVSTDTQVVQTNNQVCAGNCDQTNQQIVDNSVSQTVISENNSFQGQPPTYWVDMSCDFDAPAYRTICTGIGRGGKGAPPVGKITLPTSGLCAIVIGEDSRPERREEIRRRVPVASSGEANAGTGGVANADASGGTVSIGDVRGDNDIAIDASGGTANADASGGDNNVAIVGGGQEQFEEVVEQVVEPSTLTLTLEGNVVPGKNTTYWLDTEAGRRPARGPSLVQVADEPDDRGAIVVETWACGVSQATPGFDWFGQCTEPAVDMQFSLYPAEGGSTPLATTTTGTQGRARFGGLEPGVYQVRPEGATWCYAESDRVDASGNVLVEPGSESYVWNFLCGGPRGS